MDIARDLGWKEGEPAAVAVTSETEEQAAAAAERGGGGSGMGVSVSVMSPPPEDEENATGLHAYAMREDVAAMSAFLQAGAGEGLDIDARDEYVSKSLMGVFRAVLCVYVCVKKLVLCAHIFFGRDTRHCIWLQIEGTSPQSGFYSSTVLIKPSK